MYLGIDLGTSSVKAVLVDESGAVVQESSSPLTVSRPHPLWSEQDPQDWWNATVHAVTHIDANARLRVRAIGLSGQMHGAVLLDAAHEVLRPAILWNDGRAAAACATFEQREPRSRAICGNLAMPGFTAPKLIWVAAHEPALFARVAKVMLPKDWLRLELVGECVSEPSDAAGTLWLDVATRAWSAPLLAACELDERRMPRLVEGTAVSGTLRRDAATALGLAAGIPVAGGGGDNACGAAGIGVVDDGDALLSLGTSGVILVADARVRTAPARAVHAFCHCVPERWLRMSVMLSCTATLSAAARICGVADAAALVEQAESSHRAHPARLVMLPYLDGERTPYNDPTACGVLFGLDAGCTRGDVARAALEGVAFALADGLAALEASGPPIASLTVIGGGSRSSYWGRILAAALGRPLAYLRHGDKGPALGAARLARIAVDGDAAQAVLTRPPVARVVDPDPVLASELAPRRALFRALYRDLAPRFAAGAADDAA